MMSERERETGYFLFILLIFFFSRYLLFDLFE